VFDFTTDNQNWDTRTNTEVAITCMQCAVIFGKSPSFRKRVRGEGIHMRASTPVTINTIDNRERKDKNLQLLSRIMAFL
jgi:hypothetical protein